MKRPFIPLTLLLLLLLTSTVLADTSYVIQAGDTLSGIARQHNVTVAQLTQHNNIINPNLIYVGQTLHIPDGNTTPPPAHGESNYTVQAGDTLFRIALQHGVSLTALAQANNISNTAFIYVGQVLTIPNGSPPPPSPIPNPTPAPPPVIGNNLLPNPSFEGGWYNQNGVPELQLPNQWILEWDTGANPFDPNPWSEFVRPEVRVLSSAFLPEHERPLYIWHGNHTVKLFKGSGALSIRLLTDVTLPAGTYQLTVNAYPDMVQAYNGSQKVWASDPHAGELRLLVGNGGSGWQLPTFGQRNTLTHTFTLSQPQTVRVGVALRGRYALVNNGWFLDDWSLVKVQ